MFRSAILFCFVITKGYALQNGLYLTNDCPCPGHHLSFECVINGITEGTTVWKGSALQDACMSLLEISLLHGDFVSGIGEVSECGGGSVAWRTLGVENSSYVSQLNITYNPGLSGREIVCAYDNLEREVIIGTRIITSHTMSSYPPPTGVHLETANQEHLIFAWNPVSPSCSAIQYIIQPVNCGTCPGSTAHNSASCRQFQVNTDRKLCSFVVQSEFCQHGITSNMSSQFQIILQVPAPPSIKIIIPRYSHPAENAVGFIVQFNEVSSFNISDEVDGSALSYTLTYNNSLSGISCGSATVPASSCVNGVCQHSFTYEGSACSSASVGVNVSISAANVLGSGPSSYSMTVQEQSNTFLGVSLNLSSNSIACTFHGQQTASKRSCSIDYWLKEDRTSCILNPGARFTQTSHSTSKIVMIGLPTSSLSNEQYCFNVIGDTGTHAAVLEGTFNINTTDSVAIQDCPHQTSNGIALGLSLTFVILISLSVIITLIVIIVILVRGYKKIQIELVKVQTMKAPAPMGTMSIKGVLNPNNNRIYEELDGDITNETLDVENMAYPKRDFHRRCATPCSDGSEEDAYYTTI